MPKPPVPTEIAENMKGIKHKIVVLSGKGGVGKTTVATNLAVSFAKRGKNVGIVDVDIYGPNVPKLLGLEGQHPTVDGDFILPIVGPQDVKVMSMGFLLRKDDDAVAWRGPLVARAITQFLANVKWGELDVIVVDLPPGTGDEILSILQSIPDKRNCSGFFWIICENIANFFLKPFWNAFPRYERIIFPGTMVFFPINILSIFEKISETISTFILCFMYSRKNIRR